MRIAVVNPTSGGLSGGYRKYLHALMPLLAGHPAVTGLHVFVHPSVSLDLDFSTIAVESWPAGDAVRRFSWLRRRLLDLSPDVVFSPTARWISCGDIPVVIMLHNMEPLVIPFRTNPIGEAVKNLMRAWEARRACRRARRIIAPSHYVKGVLCKRWAIEEGRIGVVYNGVETLSNDIRTPAWATLGECRPFIFTAGSIRPARGLEDLVAAVVHLKRTCQHVETVVIAGEVSPGGSKYRRGLEKVAARAGVSEQIIWAGGLDRAQMSWCFSNCAAFVMTSRTEAGPNLVLEAMSHGCLCISADRPPMPEFFGATARYYPAGNGPALAACLLAVRAIGDHEAAQMKEGAARRARIFDWAITAENTVAQLRLALSS
jgi:glycosyltransferase involved in cell wall biosynthesis